MLQKTVSLPLRGHYPPRHHAFHCLKLAGSHGPQDAGVGRSVPPAPFVLVLRALSCLAWPWGEAVFKEVLGQALCAHCADTVTSGLSPKSPKSPMLTSAPQRAFCLWLRLLSGKRPACQAAASQPRGPCAVHSVGDHRAPGAVCRVGRAKAFVPETTSGRLHMPPAGVAPTQTRLGETLSLP